MQSGQLVGGQRNRLCFRHFLNLAVFLRHFLDGCPEKYAQQEHRRYRLTLGDAPVRVDQGQLHETDKRWIAVQFNTGFGK